MTPEMLNQMRAELGGVDTADGVIPGMETSLYPHQVYGVVSWHLKQGPSADMAQYWMVCRENNGSNTPRGGLLCDDMEVGKTMQVIALICHEQKEVRRSFFRDTGPNMPQSSFASTWVFQCKLQPSQLVLQSLAFATRHS